MKERIIAIFEEELGGHSHVTPETRLDELEFDSLEFAELMVRIGREAADIPDARWQELETVADVIAAAEKYAA